MAAIASGSFSSTPRWLLYGASGYTGRMIAEEAVRRGHRPVLAGRSAERVRPLAESLGLEWRAFGLTDVTAIREAFADCQAVLLTAGPFDLTAPPMIDACLALGIPYADIANEIPIFQLAQQRDAQARARGVALVPGVGFGVVASNCLVRFVAEQVPDVAAIQCAIHIASTQGSAGAAETGLTLLEGGGKVIRGGRLTPYRLGRGARRLRFADGERIVTPTPLGDLIAAAETTGAADVTAYSSALPTGATGAILPLVRRLLWIAPLRRQLLTMTSQGDAASAAPQAPEPRSQAWAWARGRSGAIAEAWLDMGDGYRFTAASSVLAMQRLLAGGLSGALTPAAAFGADFALTVPGVRRLTQLDVP